MADFRTFQRARREPAIPMQPVIDPAGWEPQSLGPVPDWAYRFTAQDRQELIEGVRAFRAAGEIGRASCRERVSLTV